MNFSHAGRMLVFGLAAISLTILACGSSSPMAATTTPPPAAPPTSLPTPSLPPLYLSVSLGATALKEQGAKPSYTVDASLPVLQGSDDPRAKKFNDEMTLLVQQEIGVFKDNVRELAPVPASNGSTFTEAYKLLSAPGNLLSLKIDIRTYIAGSAHPGSHSRTVSYDLETGSDVGLDQLFQSGSNYLQVLSDYCLAQLKPRIPDLVSSGLDPTPRNYQSWNITPDGLLITFDEYQVAAYALGPQQVLVPIAILKAVIDPQGPLGSSIP